MPVIITPNMGLIEPVVGQEPGPTWASDLNASLGILDQHNHSAGQGVQINPAGININSNFPMNGNNITLVNTVRFNNLLTTLAGSSPNLGCIYEAVNDLYYNDGVGNVIQITKSGSVNATSSGISSGTATASFSAGVLVVDANVNTPANVQGASFLFGNNVANSNYLTLQPPSAMASNYSVTLPPSNTTGNTAFLTYDTSNNIGSTVPYPLTQGSMGNVGQQVSASSGSFSTTSTSFVPVTNLSVTITTTGRPIMIMVQNDGSGSGYIGAESSPGLGNPFAGFGLFSNSSFISGYDLDSDSNTGQLTALNIPPGALNYLYVVGSGTYNIILQVAANVGGNTAVVNNCVLVAYEL